MRREKLKTYDDVTVQEFLTRKVHCPYHQGKIKLHQVTQWTKDKIISTIHALSGKEFKTMKYDALLKQNNEEKDMEYRLSHEIFSFWAKQAHALYAPHIPEKIAWHDIEHMASLTLEEGTDILRDAIRAINTEFQLTYPEVYATGIEYAALKRQLSKEGCRQAGQGKSENAFDHLAEQLILDQLIMQTVPYMQHLASKHAHDQAYLYHLKEAKAPKAWYFLANLGINLMWIVRSQMPGSQEFPEGEFYDEAGRHGISKEATEHLEHCMRWITAEEFTNQQRYQITSGLEKTNLTLADEAIFGCPVKDTFTQFYQLTVAILYNYGKHQNGSDTIEGSL